LAVRAALSHHVEAHQARPVDAVRAARVDLRCIRGGRAEPAPRSGTAVRFPRMLRWRRDKPVAEADTLQALRGLSPSGGEGLDCGYSSSVGQAKSNPLFDVAVIPSEMRKRQSWLCERGVGLFGIGPPILDFQSGSI
jgi:hypothetical protein